MKKIVVYLEQNNDGLVTSAYEFANKAHKLAESGEFEVVAVVMGKNSAEAAKQASVLGATKVICVEGEAFCGNFGLPYAEELCKIAEEENASYVFVENSILGRTISAEVAVGLNAALINGCVCAEVCEGSVEFYVSLENPDILAKKVSGAERTVVAFEPLSLKGLVATCYDACEVVNASAQVCASTADIVDELDVVESGKLEDAPIIITGGRGMGSEENFKDLYELADILGGSVAATRAAVFHGWADESQQVGISAKSVAPKLYIAFGVAGATQHVDGVSRSENILSVNINSTAPFVGEADFSVVGNARSIVKKLIATLK